MTNAHSAPIRILLLEGELIVREGLRRLLQSQRDFVVVGSTDDVDDATRLARSLKADVSLVGADDDSETVRQLAAVPTAVVLLLSESDRDQAVAMLRAGARGLVLKSSSPELLFRAIRAVRAGRYWAEQETAPSLEDAVLRFKGAPPEEPRLFGLTRRELEIVHAVVAGETNRMIAERLRVTEHTVKHHLTHIFDKLGVYTRLELALFAIHHQLAESPTAPKTRE